MPLMAYTGELGNLVIEVEQIEVTSNEPRPDEKWRLTDAAGHEHYWRDGYPTLTVVVDETYWCEDCADDHTDTHLECPLCGETITPGLVGPSGFREFAPGRMSATLDGEPITVERAMELIHTYRELYRKAAGGDR